VPTPDYVRSIRRHYGSGLLLLPAASGVVIHGDPARVLLCRRADTGLWEVPSGIVEPGEQPARTVVREVLEETGVEVAVERLVLLMATEEVVYPNGDHCQFLSMTFSCRYLSGEPYPADEESTAVGWFALDTLPPLPPRQQRRISCGLAPGEAAVFDT
jgi:8-oxo-dGTP diphosphatase